MKLLTAAVLFSIAISATALGQTTQPAESPDVIAAKTAAKKFHRALGEADVASLKSQFAGSPESFFRVEKLHDLMLASDHMQKVLAEKFPEAKKDPSLSTSQMSGDAAAKRIDAEHLIIDGDTAKFDNGETLVRTNGEWKVSALGGDPEANARVSEMAPAMIKAMNEVADDAEAGKFATLVDAKHAFGQKMMAMASASMRHGPTSGPGTGAR